jgi:preprotein translocase subunit SecA
MFEAMMEAIKEESVGFLFNVEVTAKGLGPQRPQRLEYSAPSVDGEAGVLHASEEIEDELPELGPDASRAERRRVERAQRKRDDKRR